MREIFEDGGGLLAREYAKEDGVVAVRKVIDERGDFGGLPLRYSFAERTEVPVVEDRLDFWLQQVIRHDRPFSVLTVRVEESRPAEPRAVRPPQAANCERNARLYSVDRRGSAE